MHARRRYRTVARKQRDSASVILFEHHTVHTIVVVGTCAATESYNT
jgi:hypothetical protein